MATAERHEVELKLIAADPAPLERLATADRLGPAELGPARTIDELDRYLDTAGGRLSAVRWACRLRTREGRVIVSLKGPRPAGSPVGMLHRRPEVEGPATAEPDPDGWPPSAARDRLHALSGGERLVERLALHQRRTERPVLVGGATVGTLSLDLVEVAVGARTRGHLSMVELELRDGPAQEAPLVEALSAALLALDGLAPDPLSKLEHALAMAETPDGFPSPSRTGGLPGR